jgi:FkbM family methyltransferase
MTPAGPEAELRTPSRARLALGRAGTAMFKRLGYDIVPHAEPGATEEEARRTRLISSLGVTLVLDIGANSGQFATTLRKSGYGGRIVSFEPLSAVFAELQSMCATDPAWECRQFALGASDGTAEINIAGNAGASSSMLEMKERHLRSAPESRYVGTEQVEVKTLDSIWPEIVANSDRVYLKLDVQGLELEVLRGAADSLAKAIAVQAELSLVPLYEGAPSYRELIDHLDERGLRLAGLEAGHDDRQTGEMLQADGIFVRGD